MARNAYFPLFKILNRWKIRGRPFESEGLGGGLANFVGTDYLFSSRAGPDYFQVYQGQNIYFQLLQLQQKINEQKEGGHNVSQISIFCNILFMIIIR